MNEEQVVSFVRQNIRSVWALEVLLLLAGDRERRWRVDALVREVRSSTAAIEGGLRNLAQVGLVAREPDGQYRLATATPALAEAADAIRALYAAKPTLVVKTILTAPDAKLRMLADAFKIKDT